MNQHQARRYLMFGRVDTFGNARVADFDPGSEAARRFAAIAQIIHDIDVAKAGQKRGRATAKKVRFDVLRLRLRAIARSARAIARDEPGFAAKFRVPESKGQMRLLTAADVMLMALRRAGVAAKFIAHELPADFVQRLRADRDACAAARDAHGRDESRGITNTAAVGRLIRAGMKEVAYLDAIICNKYLDNPKQLHAWHSAHTLARARAGTRKRRARQRRRDPSSKGPTGRQVIAAAKGMHGRNPATRVSGT